MSQFHPTYIYRGPMNEPPGCLTPSERSHSVLAVGTTGTQAHDFIHNILQPQDILANRGVTLLAFSDREAQNALDRVPKRRIKDTVYVDCADRRFVAPLNLLPHVAPDNRTKIAGDLLILFKALWGDGIRDRSEEIISKTLYAHLDLPDRYPRQKTVPGRSLYGLPLPLINKEYREYLLEHVTDQEVRRYWQEVFPFYERQKSKEYLVNAVGPVQNKFGQLLANRYIRNPLCGAERHLDFADIIQKEKILIVNLNQGKIGLPTARMLANVYVTTLRIAADTLSGDAPNHYLYLTNIEEYAVDVLALLFKSDGPVKSHVALATTGDITSALQRVILSRFKIQAVFHTEKDDAELFSKSFGSVKVQPATLVSQSPDHFHIKLPYDLEPQDVRMLALGERAELGLLKQHGNGEQITRHSQNQFLVRRSRVERALDRFDHEWKSSFA